MVAKVSSRVTVPPDEAASVVETAADGLSQCVSGGRQRIVIGHMSGAESGTKFPALTAVTPN